MRSKKPNSLVVADGILAVVDLLGTTECPDNKLRENIEALVEASALNTGQFHKSGQITYFKKANVFLVGDAVWISQRTDSVQSGFDVVNATLGISAELFARNLPHRAMIHLGPYESRTFGRSSIPPILTGKAVVEAVRLEQSLKIVGIGLSKALVKSRAAKWTTLKPGTAKLWFSPKIGGQVMFTALAPSYHAQEWQRFAHANLLSHSYVAAAHALLSEWLPKST